MGSELQTMNGRNKLALWAERVSACRSSDLSVRDWCKENDICEQTYYGIRVTALCPGSTATSWWSRWTHSFGTDAMLPVETLADIAELIVTSPEKVLFKQLQVLPTVEIDNF